MHRPGEAPREARDAQPPLRAAPIRVAARDVALTHRLRSRGSGTVGVVNNRSKHSAQFVARVHRSRSAATAEVAS
jgi:hypothetical protein